MKKLFALCMTLIMVFSLVACGDSGKNAESKTEPEAKPNTGAQTEVKPENTPEDSYPNDGVITWYTQNAGTPADTVARLVGTKMGEILGQTVIFENAGGAGGMNMLNPVLAADADGYTLSSLGVAHLCLTPFSADCPFSLEDFDYIGCIVSQPQCFVVPADAPYNSMEEWTKYVIANPGTFNIGVQGASSVHNLCAMGLKVETGLNFNTVSYDKEPEVMAAIMGKHIGGGIVAFSSAEASVSSGDVKLLAFTTEVKAPGYEDVSSLAELGYESRGVSFQGLIVKKGLPENRLNMLREALQTALADDELIAGMKAANLYYPETILGGEDFAVTVADTTAFYEEVLTETGLMQELYG